MVNLNYSNRKVSLPVGHCLPQVSGQRVGVGFTELGGLTESPTHPQGNLSQVQIFALQPIPYVTLNKSLALSGPQFPHS